MPRLIPPELGNGKRPSDPDHSSGAPNDSVPVLDLSEDMHEIVGLVHDEALDSETDTGLLLGAIVMVDNPRPKSGAEGHVIYQIGASTLHEAATEVVGSLGTFALDMPEWVASTDAQLAQVVAEHYTLDGYSTCRVIEMSEVPS